MIFNGPPAEPVIRALASQADADVYVYSAPITNDLADILIEKVRAVQNRRANAILVLTTEGGSPDAAYRIARCLKRHYTRFILHVFGVCYSAGTLIAVGSDEIVMSEAGQLGPLDVQLADKNEFLGQTAALDVSQALQTLSENAFDFFIVHFFNMGPGRGMSTQTASDIAQTLTLGIIEPIAKQIDPLLLGRVDRSMRIAEAYASRLNPSFRNIKKLIQGYPSHEFVIDFAEANDLFSNVRGPNPEEIAFENLLRSEELCPNQHVSGYVEQFDVAPLPPSPTPSNPSSNATIPSPNAESAQNGAVTNNGNPTSAAPIEAVDGPSAPVAQSVGRIHPGST